MTACDAGNIIFKVDVKRLLRGAERIWPMSGARAERGRWSEAQPNGEGVASGSATQILF